MGNAREEGERSKLAAKARTQGVKIACEGGDHQVESGGGGEEAGGGAGEARGHADAERGIRQGFHAEHAEAGGIRSGERPAWVPSGDPF